MDQDKLKKITKKLKKLTAQMEEITPAPPAPEPKPYKPYSVVLSTGECYKVEDLDVRTYAPFSRYVDFEAPPRVNRVMAVFRTFGRDLSYFDDVKYAFVVHDARICYEGKSLVKNSTDDLDKSFTEFTLEMIPRSR